MLQTIFSIFLLVNLVLASNLNVFNEPLELCSDDPLTGYTRTGYCVANQYDQGSHFVCASVTREFLDYTKSVGNDLSTPHPPYFPGLKPGDNWCLCVYRWIQAKNAGFQPPVVLRSTNNQTLDFLRNYNLTIDDLQENATLNQNISNGFVQARKEL